MNELPIYAAIVLIPLAVQLVILFLTANRFRFLRFAIPVLVGIAAAVCLLAGILNANGMWAGLYWAAIILVLLGLGLVLVGYGLAWFVYCLVKYLLKRKASDAH